VRLVLAEKGLQFSGETLDLQRGDQHRPDYAKLNPNEVVPTLIHDGKVIIESTPIIEYLDEVFSRAATDARRAIRPHGCAPLYEKDRR
jgi:glutathione S-transferase